MLVDEFIKYCTQILEANFGHISNEIVENTRKKKNIDENSGDVDIKEFINIIEANLSIFAGKQKATNICNIIREKSSEFERSKEKMDTEKFGYISKITNIGKITEIGNPTDDFEKKVYNEKGEVNNVKNLNNVKKVQEVEKMDTNEVKEESRLEYDESRIMVLLESGYGIDNILNELDIEEEILADKIIDLDSKDLIILENKNWSLTKKGEDSLKKKREEYKKLKLDYLHGIISKAEFLKKNKELDHIKKIENIDKKNKELDKENIDKKNKELDKENITESDDKLVDDVINKTIEDDSTENIQTKEEKLICTKCGTENRIGNRFCTKCGDSGLLVAQIM